MEASGATMLGGMHAHGGSDFGTDGMHSWVSWEATDLEGGRILRKQLVPELASDDATVARWLAKVAQNAALSSAACARVLDWGRDEHGPYVISRFDGGIPLRSLLRHEPAAWPIELAVHVACGLLEASVHASALDERLAHLDLDPDGVLVRHDGTLRVPAFGLWGALPPRELSRRRFASARVHYASPELVRAEPLDPRSDVFSVGTMLCELLTGRRPFDGATQLVAALAIAEGARRPIAELAPGVPRALCEVVEAMLATRVDERFQSARAAREVLRRTVPTAALARGRLAVLAARCAGHSGPAQPGAAARTDVGLRVSTDADRRVRSVMHTAAEQTRIGPLLGTAAHHVAVVPGALCVTSALPSEPLSAAVPLRGAADDPAPPPLVVGVGVPSPSAPRADVDGLRDDDHPRLHESSIAPRPPVRDRVGAGAGAGPVARVTGPPRVARAAPGYRDPSSTVFRRSVESLRALPARNVAWGARLGWGAVLGVPLLATFYFLARLFW